MIEIVCPSCEARYQVPDDSIGPEGRRVTCSACSHKWRAYPEGAPASAQRATESTAESPAEATRTEAASTEAASTEAASTEAASTEAASTEAASTEAAGPGEAGPAEPAAGGQTPAGGREEQMDAIRRMLDDLKRSAEDEPEPEPEPEPAATRSQRSDPSVHRRRESEEPDDPDAGGDPLRSHLARMQNDGRSGKDAGRSPNYDAAKLRKMHEKRARRMQKARERKRGSSAFLTGFTLVAAVAGVMVGLYVLQPQIVESSPRMAPAMNEYVVTVDRYRVALDRATADWREWVAERVGPLLGGDDEQAQGTQTSQAG